jgi:hypothetical protein
MDKMISIHDNIVTGHSVSCEKYEIILHTEFRDREPNEKTDIIFLGVEAYYFIGDNMQSILFGVDECPLEEILKEYSPEFEDGSKYAWPGPWNESKMACAEYLKNKKCKGWLISSSYGMGGFVIGKSMELKRL